MIGNWGIRIPNDVIGCVNLRTGWHVSKIFQKLIYWRTNETSDSFFFFFGIMLPNIGS